MRDSLSKQFFEIVVEPGYDLCTFIANKDTPAQFTHDTQNQIPILWRQQRVQQMHCRLGALLDIQIRVILETSQLVSDPECFESRGSCPASLVVALVLFVDQVNHHPDAVSSHVSVGVIEIVRERSQ